MHEEIEDNWFKKRACAFIFRCPFRYSNWSSVECSNICPMLVLSTGSYRSLKVFSVLTVWNEMAASVPRCIVPFVSAAPVTFLYNTLFLYEKKLREKSPFRQSLIIGMIGKRRTTLCGIRCVVSLSLSLSSSKHLSDAKDGVVFLGQFHFVRRELSASRRWKTTTGSACVQFALCHRLAAQTCGWYPFCLQRREGNVCFCRHLI